MFPPREVALDTNVLLLFLVGFANPEGISRHKRLAAYDSSAFELLRGLVSQFDRIVVTPGCVAEVSNLLDYDRASRERLFSQLKTALHSSDQFREEYVPSRQATEEGSFMWLGITDATYVELSKRGLPVITADFSLYQQVVGYSPLSINFPALLFNRTT